jgi:uncharacterized membrane protein
MGQYMPTPKEIQAARVYYEHWGNNDPAAGARTKSNYQHYVDTLGKDGWKFGKLGWTKQAVLPGLDDNSYRPYSTDREE